jgi:hypothetical protein
VLFLAGAKERVASNHLLAQGRSVLCATAPELLAMIRDGFNAGQAEDLAEARQATQAGGEQRAAGGGAGAKASLPASRRCGVPSDAERRRGLSAVEKNRVKMIAL